MNVVLPIVSPPSPPGLPDRPRARATAVVAAPRGADRPPGRSSASRSVHLESGRRLSSRGGERFQMASVFKLPVAIAVLGAVETGTLRLDAVVEIRRSDRRKIGPLDDEWKPGMRVSVARMVDVMLVDSDNTAADKLIALLGGPRAVQKDLESLGVAGVRISLDEKGMGAAIKKDLAAFESGAEERREPGRDGGAPRASLPRRAALARRDGPHPRRDAPVRDRRQAPCGRASRRGPRSSTRPGPSGAARTTSGS